MKKSHKEVLQLFAIIIMVAILFSFKKEGFQNIGNLAAVGFQFTGPLSLIYKSLTAGNSKIWLCTTSTPAKPSEIYCFPAYMTTLMTNPSSVLLTYMHISPQFKYLIIELSTGNIIYDPISEYATKGTMSPFPNTDKSDDYIIYSNLFNMNIKKGDDVFYPFSSKEKPPPPTAPGTVSFGGMFKRTNCVTQAERTATEDLIKRENLIIPTISTCPSSSHPPECSSYVSAAESALRIKLASVQVAEAEADNQCCTIA